MSLDAFHPAVQRWFSESLGEPTEPQRRGWPSIQRGQHTLIAAPTGSGKTLTAFLSAIDSLVRQGLEAPLPDAVQVVYVSPLKALSNDIEQNLQKPLSGIRAALAQQGLPDVPVRTMVRTGDTPSAERARFAKRPSHILVTTPESLYVLLTSDSGRAALKHVSTVIVDEIHALLGNKRGSHLALSLERLESLSEQTLTRVGLSATQKPIEDTAAFLLGADPAREPCQVVDCGLRSDLDLQLELTDSPLEAVMATEVWDEVYERLAELVRQHGTTLVFVNTRRLAERVTRHLGERLGEAQVAAHHGSLSKEHRLKAETRLREGDLSVLVATASLELGIDIGHVDLVCQIGSTRTIAALIQRVGRSGHFLGGTPRGRIFPLSRNQLLEATALIEAVRNRSLDRIEIPEAPLDILAQQITAELSCGERGEQELFDLVSHAYPYRGLTQERFNAVLSMLAQGFDTPRGRRAALIHHDRVNQRLRPRKAARLTSITSGGAIPDNADYTVLLEPSGVTIGSLNEDFAIESMAGDVFQLGNTSYRIQRVEKGTVRVQDARGMQPTIPFWLGEAPARSRELSEHIWALLRASRELLELTPKSEALCAALRERGMQQDAAEQLADYLSAAHAGLGTLPDGRALVVERFFDEAGGMQLVIHSPHGGRINRAWGLSLRKRFCRSFNFELQAAATEDAIILSLGPTHSFPLEDVQKMLRSSSVREVLIQALLDAPMFETRWRWNTNRALAVPRFGGGRRVPPFLQRMRADDLLAVVFPDANACLENVPGDREIPDHPLVEQTVRDCLTEAMDIDGLQVLLDSLERGETAIHFRDTTEPSLLAHEILNANPYAFLDDAPLEERRTQAVLTRRLLDTDNARALGALDAEAIARVQQEAWPDFEDADELHDAACCLGYMTDAEVGGTGSHLRDALCADGRMARLTPPSGEPLWISAERLQQLRAVHPEAALRPDMAPAPGSEAERYEREQALLELVRGRMESSGPLQPGLLAGQLQVQEPEVLGALAALEAEGAVLRGRFAPDSDAEQWCERRLLARIHRYTLQRLRREIEPVSAQTFMRFLFDWQRVTGEERLRGSGGLDAALQQLSGHAAPALAWETDILPARVEGYDPAWLDQLCLSGRYAWARPASGNTGKRARPLRSTPVAIVERSQLPELGRDGTAPELGAAARRLRDSLGTSGASFFHDLAGQSGLLGAQLEEAMAELVAQGLASSDSFAGLRALLRPSQGRGSGRSGRRRPTAAAMPGMEGAGRWALLPAPPELDEEARLAHLEAVARHNLKRHGVVFRKLLERRRDAPWRDLLRVYRRLEARGEVRGGRFVAGFTGEQFALPEAVKRLRDVRRRAPDGSQVTLSACDPLNLVGVVVPGDRVAAVATNRLLFRDGLPVAVLEAGEVRVLCQLEESEHWETQLALRRHQVPARVRMYM